MSQTPTLHRASSRLGNAAGKGSPEIPRLASRELLGERRELVIEHNGREYRLRLTQSGKLILTA